MALEFLEQQYAEHLSGNRQALTEMFETLMERPAGCVIVAETDGVLAGGICGHVYRHPMSGNLVASEVGWWMDPHKRGAGMRVLRAFEAWARAHGAEAIQMIAPNARVGSFYARLGYRLAETTYQRRLA